MNMRRRRRRGVWIATTQLELEIARAQTELSKLRRRFDQLDELQQLLVAQALRAHAVSFRNLVSVTDIGGCIERNDCTSEPEWQ